MLLCTTRAHKEQTGSVRFNQRIMVAMKACAQTKLNTFLFWKPNDAPKCNHATHTLLSNNTKWTHTCSWSIHLFCNSTVVFLFHVSKLISSPTGMDKKLTDAQFFFPWGISTSGFPHFSRCMPQSASRPLLAGLPAVFGWRIVLWFFLIRFGILLWIFFLVPFALYLQQFGTEPVILHGICYVLARSPSILHGIYYICGTSTSQLRYLLYVGGSNVHVGFFRDL